MNGPRKLFVSITLTILLAGLASASDIYIAQNAAGANTGADCGDAHSAAWFNSSSNWGTASGQIGPDDSAHLCGLISTNLAVQGSGTASSPITIVFETGAAIVSVCGGSGCLNAAGRSYILVDGGMSCGWVNGSQTACNGTIASSAATPGGSHFGIVADSCSGCEFRNLTIGPIFQATANGAQASGDIRGIQNLRGTPSGSTYKVHNNIIHDAASGIVYVPSGSNDNGLQVYNNSEYNINSSVDISNNNNGNLTAAEIHDNHFGSTGNWDNAGCPQHHNSLHAFAYTTSNSGIDYYNNLIDGNWGNCPTSGLFIEGNGSNNSNVSVFNNVWLMTYQQENNGIVSITAGGYVRFYNNTVIGVQSSDTCVGINGNGGAAVYIENNIISSCTTLLDTSSISDYKTVDYNLYGGNKTNPWTDQSLPAWYASLSQWQAHCKCDAHSSFGAASSYVGVNADGTLASDSPAITFGTNLSGIGLAALDDDITGAGRPGGPTNWDNGAFDSGSGSNAPAPPSGLTAQVQ